MLTSSLGLSDSSSGTVVVVLLSLAVAADAGDMVKRVQKPVHGSPLGMGGFQSRVRQKHAEDHPAHHPKQTSPEGARTQTLRGGCILSPATFQVGRLLTL